MKLARRLDKIPPYLFVEINRKIAEKKARGEDVISFAIGDPDTPTPAHIIESLCTAAHDPANHRYPETFGTPELCQAIAGWYKKRFNVDLDPTKEVLPLIGSKEGIGRYVFLPAGPGRCCTGADSGYPVYSISSLLAGVEVYYLPLLESNAFLPDLDTIPANF